MGFLSFLSSIFLYNDPMFDGENSAQYPQNTEPSNTHMFTYENENYQTTGYQQQWNATEVPQQQPQYYGQQYNNQYWNQNYRNPETVEIEIGVQPTPFIPKPAWTPS